MNRSGHSQLRLRRESNFATQILNWILLRNIYSQLILALSEEMSRIGMQNQNLLTEVKNIAIFN